MATAVASPIFHPIVAPYPKFLCSMANEILSSGIHIKVAKRDLEFGCCSVMVVSCPSSSNNEGKNRGGRNAILAASYPLKIAILELPRLERVPIQEKSHALPQRE